MSKVIIYGKQSAVAVEVIDNVEEHYCTNGMFYVRAEGQEFYFSLEAISMIRVETESDKEGEECTEFYNKRLATMVERQLIKESDNNDKRRNHS